MSTCWGFHCLTCGVSTEFGINHGEDVLRQYAKLKWIIAERDFDMSWLDISVMGHDWMSDEFAAFFEEHGDQAEHHIVLKSEYGDIKEI